jgi:hypothetical protein
MDIRSAQYRNRCRGLRITARVIVASRSSILRKDQQHERFHGRRAFADEMTAHPAAREQGESMEICQAEDRPKAARLTRTFNPADPAMP